MTLILFVEEAINRLSPKDPSEQLLRQGLLRSIPCITNQQPQSQLKRGPYRSRDEAIERKGTEIYLNDRRKDILKKFDMKTERLHSQSRPRRNHKNPRANSCIVIVVEVMMEI